MSQRVIVHIDKAADIPRKIGKIKTTVGPISSWVYESTRKGEPTFRLTYERRRRQFETVGVVIVHNAELYEKTEEALRAALGFAA